MKTILIIIIVILSLIGSTAMYANMTAVSKGGVNVPNWFVWLSIIEGRKLPTDKRVRTGILVSNYSNFIKK